MAGQGAAIGGTLGAIGGSIIPGVGTAVGGAVGSGVGSFIDSIAAKRQGESSTPSMMDPEQLLLLDEIERRRKAMEQGTDTASQAGLMEAEETGAATRDALTRSTGGNVSSTVDALLKSQRMEDRSKAGVLAQTQSKIPYYQSLQEQLQDKISQRTLDLTMFNKANKSAQEAQFGKEALMNQMAGTATGAYDPLYEGAANGTEKLMSAFTDMLKNRKGSSGIDKSLTTDSMGVSRNAGF